MALDQKTLRFPPVPRRRFLAASAAVGATLLLPGAARSASVRELEGSVSVNGKSATNATRVRTGDLIETGPDSKVVFVLGQDAFLLRERSTLKLERPTSSGKVAISSLRLETGALLAVFGKGSRLIETATARGAAGTRVTGVYLEASAEQTYFCTCYGTVELRDKTGRQRKLLVSTYHTPTIIYAQTVAGRLLAAAAVKDHTDAELIMLDALVGRTSPVLRRQQKQKAATAPEQPEPPQPAASEPVAEKQPPTRRERQSPKEQPTPEPEQAAAPTPGPVPEPPSPVKPQTPPPDEELRLPPARLND
jgi:hypothetical protein